MLVWCLQHMAESCERNWSWFCLGLLLEGIQPRQTLAAAESLETHRELSFQSESSATSSTMSPHVSHIPMVSPFPQPGSSSSIFSSSHPQPSPPGLPALLCHCLALAAALGGRQWSNPRSSCLTAQRSVAWDSWFVASGFIPGQGPAPRDVIYKHIIVDKESLMHSRQGY